MTETIDSTIRMRNVKKEEVLATLNKFKAMQDVPYTEIECAVVGDSAIDLTIKYPTEIFDKTVAQFMAALFGELPYMRGFGDLRFMRLDLPVEVFGWFGGPRFGAEGIRKRFGFNEFPFLMSIVKPSVDLERDREGQREKFTGPLAAGFHAVKDDEMQASLPNLTVDDRLALAAEHKGYIPALNLDDFERYREILSDERLSMILVNASIIGFPMLNRLCRETRVPVLSHLSMQGTYDRTFSPGLYAFLHRLFGCDAFITAIGEAGYYNASKQDEIDMVEALTVGAPISKTLPLLAGGARDHNLEPIMAPYEKSGIPYGLVFGSFVFNSEWSPRIMAEKVVDAVRLVKGDMTRGR